MQTEEILKRAAEYRAVREALGLYRIELGILPAGSPAGLECEPGRAGAASTPEGAAGTAAAATGRASPRLHGVLAPAPDGDPHKAEML